MIPPPVRNISYLGMGLGIIIAIAGAIGNFMAIAAYCFNKRIQTPFNMLVVNLAVVDFIASSVITPITISGYYETKWIFSTQTCVAFGYFYFATRYTSSVLLVVISFNRFCHVSQRHSAYTRIFSGKRRWVVGPLLWLFGPFFLLPLVFTDGFNWWDDALLCTYTRNSLFNNIYSLGARIVFQLIPLILIVVLYTLVFRAVRKSHAKVDNLIAERCESVMMSTDTMASAPSPVRTPTKASAQSTYALGPNSLIGRSSPSTPNKDKVIWQLEPHLGSELQRKTSNQIPTPTPESPNDFTIATLQKNSVQVSFATLCRSSTCKSIESSKNSYMILKEETETLTKKRSATCSNLNTSQLRLSASLQSMIEASKMKSIENRLNATAPEREKQGFYTPRRPRQLSVTPLYLNKSLKEQSPFTRQANMSLPNLRRSRRAVSSPCAMYAISSPPEMKRKPRRRKSIQHAKAQRNLLYMSAIICTAFALCSLPSLILNFLGNYDTVSSEFHMLATILSWLTSLINPIVYAAMNMQFRKEYSRMLERITGGYFGKRKKEVKKCSLTKQNCVPSIRISGCD